MKKDILYIAVGLLLGIAGCWIFCKQAKINFGNETTPPVEEDVSVEVPVVETRDPETSDEPDLVDFEGIWHAVKYEKNNVSSREYDKSDNYAEQFSRYALFSISDDTMYVDGRCEQRVYVKRFPSKLEDTNYYEQTPFVLRFKPETEYVYCIAPKTRIFNGPCIEGYDALYIHNNQLVITDMGYFFYFERGMPKSDYTISGTPGDMRSVFEVTRDFKNCSFNKVYTQFLVDFPYERDFFTLEELPLEDYSFETKDEISVHYKYLSESEIGVIRETTQGFIVILKLEYMGNDVTRLRYYLGPKP